MDKKSLIAVIFLVAILVAIVVVVFIYDGTMNTTVLEVNGVKYDVTDFENYLKVRQYEAGETPVVIDDEFSTYQVYKLFAQYAKSKNVKLPAENAVPELTEDEYATLSTDYNLSKEDYMNTKTEIALVDYVYANLQDFYDLSDEEYNSHISASTAPDPEKMYYYRIMQVAVEAADTTEEVSGETLSGDVSGNSLSGDVSGEISGDASGDLVDDEQVRKNAAMSKAVEALARVKSGDNFEAVAEEYGSSRLIFTPDGSIDIVNGKQEVISGYYMDDYVMDTDIINALRTLNLGEYSEIFESSTGTSYCFVYLEDVKEGLEGADRSAFVKEIANEHIQGNAVVVPNRFPLKSIKLEELIPALAKANIDTQTSGDVLSGDVSGESNPTETSGDVSNNVSGDTSSNTSGEELNGGDVVE